MAFVLPTLQNGFVRRASSPRSLLPVLPDLGRCPSDREAVSRFAHSSLFPSAAFRERTNAPGGIALAPMPSASSSVSFPAAIRFSDHCWVA